MIEFDQQPCPGVPGRFRLHLRCPSCPVEATFERVTGGEAQRWINLFGMCHERAGCPRRTEAAGAVR